MEWVALAVVGVFAGLSGAFVARWVQNAQDAARRKRAMLLFSALSGGADGGGVRTARRREGRRAKVERALEVERHVPEMVEAIALGMRAGLSFESAFRLYCFRFDDVLALKCREACRGWESGLVLRDEALRAMARDCGVPVLDRFVGNVTRCLRFGSPMGRMLDVLAAEARSCYRAKMEERVAKAPVKMLMPTAALILPAMLILVMAPVLLEFV